jgi:Fic family protein
MRREDFTLDAPGGIIQSTLGYEAFLPNALPPELPLTWSLVQALSAADRAVSELAGVARNLPNPHLLINPFLRREAVLSSRIEGTQASLSDLFVFEASEHSEAPQSDVEEVVNYIHALEYGLHVIRQGRRISLTLLKEMHELLLRDVRGQDKSPGQFRTKQNWIAEGSRRLENARFVPPPVPQMHDALDALEGYIQAPSDLPPLVRLALIHYQFETIHPFEDGNGRIGRLLITLLLCAEGLLPEPLLYLSAYFERHRDGYVDRLLGVSQSNAWEDWMTFFLTGIAEQGRDGIHRAGRLMELRETYRRRLQAGRSSALTLQLTDELFAYPAMSITQTAARLKVTRRAIDLSLNKLISEKILVESTGRQRNRVFVAPAIIQIIEATEATAGQEKPSDEQ